MQFSLAGQHQRLLRHTVASGRVTLRRHPLVAKALPTAFGFAFGDCLTQHLNKRKPDAPYDFVRTAKMGFLGLVVAGPVGLAFFRWMDAHILPQAPRVAMAVKLLLDQVLGCILWQAAFLSIHPPYREAALNLCQQTANWGQGQSQRFRKSSRGAPAAL